MTTIEPLSLPSTGVWAIDSGHSTVSFSVRHHAVARFRAGFAPVRGQYDADRDRLSGAVSVSDAVIPGMERLAGHLQSPDFFDAAQHPELSFAATGLRESPGALEGELTMRGVTQPIPVTMTLIGGPREVRQGNGALSDRFGLDLSSVVDRRAFGIDFNNEIAAGVANLGWEVAIEVSLELVLPREG